MGRRKRSTHRLQECLALVEARKVKRLGPTVLVQLGSAVIVAYALAEPSPHIRAYSLPASNLNAHTSAPALYWQIL